MIKRTTLIICILSFGLFQSYSQDFSKNALFAGAGIGIMPMDFSAGGLLMIGCQQDIWKNRLRVVPSLSIGTYFPSGEDVVGGVKNSITLRYNVNFDVLKIKSFSLFIGSGLTFNSTVTWRRSNSLADIHFAVNALAGFRVSPPNRKMAYELALFNGSFARRFIEMAIFQIRVIRHLK